MRPEIGRALAQFAGSAVDAFFRGRDEARRRRETSSPAAPARYPGDYKGLPQMTYSPHPGAQADPGEVVWAWVPYEEDYNQGKDRPVLILGRDGTWLLGLPLSSVDHDSDAAQEARQNRFWVSIGPGNWDKQGRDSFVRVDRIVRLDPNTVRRIGGQVTPAEFAAVAKGLQRHWND